MPQHVQHQCTQEDYPKHYTGHQTLESLRQYKQVSLPQHAPGRFNLLMAKGGSSYCTELDKVTSRDFVQKRATTHNSQPTTTRQSMPHSGARLARFRQAARQRQSQPTRRTRMLAEDDSHQRLIRGEFHALTERQQPYGDPQVSRFLGLTPTSTTVSVASSQSLNLGATPTTSGPPTASGPVMSSQLHPWLPPRASVCVLLHVLEVVVVAILGTGHAYM